jgi:dipeptidyl aminopeptidase/acylaminoacyl peptidase
MSPDGKSVLVVGTDKQRSEEKDYDGGIYSIDIKTGISDEIMRFKQDNVQHSNNIEWDKEGESIFYTSDNHIIKRNIATAGEKILYTDKNLFFMPALRRSFDGNHLLFDGVINSTETLVLNEGKAHLLNIPEEGGEARILCDAIFSPAGMYKRISLSPDGKYIYFSARTPVIKSVLCRIPTEGGTPEIVWQSKDYNIAGISIHPDGRQIALSTSVSQVEIRVIENLGNEVIKVFSENK